MGWSKYEATLPDHGMHTMQYYSERSEVYTRARSSSVWLLCELLKHRSRLPHRVEFHRRLQGCQTKWATFTKRGGSYKSTLVLDSMTHQVKPCVDLKLSPFLANLDVGFFSVATDVKLRFLSFGSFTVATSLQNPWILFAHWANTVNEDTPLLRNTFPGPLMTSN